MDFTKARDRLKEQALERKLEEDRVKLELEEKTEKDAKRLREWRQVHWTQESEVRYEEARQSKAKHLETVQRGFDQSIKGTYDEWANRDKTRQRMQVGCMTNVPNGMPTKYTL